MSIWIMSANPKYYNHEKAFKDQGYIVWKQTRNFEVGDIVYIYCTKPLAQVRYKTIVSAVNLEPRIDEYWIVDTNKSKIGSKSMKLTLAATCDSEKLKYDSLQIHGMKYPPQSPGRISEELRQFIEPIFMENSYEKEID